MPDASATGRVSGRRDLALPPGSEVSGYGAERRLAVIATYGVPARSERVQDAPTV
ncbi:MAG TPA: hypothetical protein VN767_11820 [Streptosporangiaceae bacterium]|nr:hypothetical protein [Streptosporangiaceae bacterium]